MKKKHYINIVNIFNIIIKTSTFDQDLQYLKAIFLKTCCRNSYFYFSSTSTVLLLLLVVTLFFFNYNPAEHNSKKSVVTLSTSLTTLGIALLTMELFLRMASLSITIRFEAA